MVATLLHLEHLQKISWADVLNFEEAHLQKEKSVSNKAYCKSKTSFSYHHIFCVHLQKKMII